MKYTCKSCGKQHRNMSLLIACLESHIDAPKVITQVQASNKVYRIIATTGSKKGEAFKENGKPVDFQDRLTAIDKMMELAKQYSPITLSVRAFEV